MRWIVKLRESSKAQPSQRRVDNPLATEYARDAIAGHGEKPADAGGPPDAVLTDEVKRQQVSLIVRYCVLVRAR